MYSVHCTMYNVHCTLYNVQCTMYNVQCALYNAQCTIYNVQCTVYIVQCTVYSVHCTMYPAAVVGSQDPRKNLGSHIDASHSRQPLVKGERLVRYEVNAVMLLFWLASRMSLGTKMYWLVENGNANTSMCSPIPTAW